MQRILTGVVLSAVSIVAIFTLSPQAFLALCLAISVWAAAELVRICRRWTPESPLGALLVLAPLTAAALAYLVTLGEVHVLAAVALPAAVLLASTLVVLSGGAPLGEGAVAMGLLTFAALYFAVPVASLYALQRRDPWLVLVLVAMVGLGDTAAFFVGTWIGRHRMAPRVSPKKSWEGSAAGVLAAVAVMAVWCEVRLGEPRLEWLLLAAATQVVAQLGDLLESLVKRGAGVKDSSKILPGHGGVWDRTDALLLAAPAFLLGLWILRLWSPPP